MGFFRFRRSIKLFPGVLWNIGKKSSSLSFGGKGAHYTVGGPRGSRTTVGIPGTGLSYTETSGHSSSPSTTESSGCAGCLGQIIVLLLVLGGISMCVNSGKESPADKKPAAKPTATPQASATPTPQPTPAPTATPLPFPESPYWPKKVRLLKPVEFTGSVSGGTVRSTVSAGTILPAHLSEDHQSVEVRMNDLTTTIPLADTDFLKRAVARQKRLTN
ncbi:MAG: DUF4236 domain-containing protein [Verrucomicrobia bacterium]|nr:DUF4236 domain-containing protein [Verrucomicrobiota bacterium]